jgi:hypothetical protein
MTAMSDVTYLRSTTNTVPVESLWKVRPRTSAWYQLYVEATRRNLILPDLPALRHHPPTIQVGISDRRPI